ncbi:hypothetical protein JNW91_08225 [Micromonospora sp. STR1_7]|uniref:Uncharacterized protein n=1 Tax=Micromonospora parastrephiae TaxID=2806101 RepID=A0ABS1XRJ6_9ACTN|nr:hypothetical protein [Micromonospora parastrephiae]MBM0231843.1 hypothetical protein [Micromonospora parastrephiae]
MAPRRPALVLLQATHQPVRRLDRRPVRVVHPVGEDDQRPDQQQVLAVLGGAQLLDGGRPASARGEVVEDAPGQPVPGRRHRRTFRSAVTSRCTVRRM